jgi:hypothetical protein
VVVLSGAGDAQGSRERADYDALLRELHAGGTPAKVYRDWLTNALDRIDVFFGDPGRNDKSWVARVLGLETPGARWTAPAFDRCLLLALLYPFVTIVGVWIWSGHVGVAERALGLWETLADSPLGLMRSAYGLSLVAAVYAGRRWLLAKRVLASLLWAVACIVAIAFALALAGGGAVVLAVGGAFAFAGAGVGAFAVAVAFGDAVAGTVGDVLSGTVAGVVPDAGAVIFAFAVGLISAWSVETRRHGTFLSLFFLAAVLAAFSGGWFLSSSDTWPDQGAVLLIFGLLTLVNAPFDWFAIGLTRALLRRGLAPGGPGPFFYAAIDTIVAAHSSAMRVNERYNGAYTTRKSNDGQPHSPL